MLIIITAAACYCCRYCAAASYRFFFAFSPSFDGCWLSRHVYRSSSFAQLVARLPSLATSLQRIDSIYKSTILASIFIPIFVIYCPQTRRQVKVDIC